MAGSTTTLSVLNITSFENLAEKITTFLPHGWSIFLLEDGVCLTYQSLNPGKLESVWERTLVLGQPTQAHSTNRMYEIITKTKGSDTVDCSTVFVSSLIDVLKLLDLSHTSGTTTTTTAAATTTATTQPLPEEQQPRQDPSRPEPSPSSSLSSLNKQLHMAKSSADQLAAAAAAANATPTNGAPQDGGTLLVQNNALVTSIDLYNCSQENGGFDFSGFDVTMMAGGGAQAAGTASPVGGVVPSVSLLPPQSCVSATAITPSVTQTVGLPDEESRAAAATTVDKLFNLGLTEVKEEAGDGSGLVDVSARVVKTELVVLKGLDATVDEDDDDDAQGNAGSNHQGGIIEDHDPHDIGPLVTLNVADLEPVKSPEDLLSLTDKDPTSRKTTVLNIEIPSNDASRFVAAINDKVGASALTPDPSLAQGAAPSPSPAPSSASENSSSNSSSSSTAAVQGRRVRRGRSIFAPSSAASGSANHGHGTAIAASGLDVVTVANVISQNPTVQIAYPLTTTANSQLTQLTSFTLTPSLATRMTSVPMTTTVTTIDASSLGLVTAKPKKQKTKRTKEDKNKVKEEFNGVKDEKHGDEEGKKYNCIYCPLTFASQCALKMHATQHSFKCSSCHKIFVNRGALTEHRKQEHTGNDGEAGYRCTKCKRAFTRKFNWTKHVANKSCTGDVKNECKMENGSEKSVPQMSNHVDLYTHTCSQCSKVYKNVSDLNRHTRFVHFRIRPYKCQLCPASFPQSGGLKEHMRIHTGEKPFVCPVCGMRFTRNFNMKEHLTKHGSSKPYQCRFCEENFQTRHIRTRHEQDVHKSILKEQLKEESQ